MVRSIECLVIVVHHFVLWRKMIDFTKLFNPLMSDSKSQIFIIFLSSWKRQLFTVLKCMIMMTRTFVILTNFFFMKFCDFMWVITCEKISKKFMQNEMSIFFQKSMSLRDFEICLLWNGKVTITPISNLIFKMFMFVFRLIYRWTLVMKDSDIRGLKGLSFTGKGLK